METALIILACLLSLASAALVLWLRAEVRSARDDDAASAEKADSQWKEASARLESAIAGSSKELRDEVRAAQRDSADAITQSIRAVTDAQARTIDAAARAQGERLDSFSTNLARQSETLERRFDELRKSVDDRLRQIQQDNEKKLDQMRQTVDEKLQSTLEKRLGESFKQVSIQLEQVQRGFGEMQALASGVGDLKRVLTNVSTRGAWGEVKLQSLLEDILTPDQYDTNVVTRTGTSERVEFAIKLPGRDEGDAPVWLPLDAKFPMDEYERLCKAAERADADAIETSARQLESSLRTFAKTIGDKYVNPPTTTDFALMFLPTEGLFAEALRRPGLFDRIRREHRVILTGPTTLTAMLGSLQMGFRTLAIQKRSSEVWEVLAKVRTEFSKFGGALDAVKKKLDEASGKIEDAQKRSRVLSKALNKAESLPTAEAKPLLDGILLDSADEDDA